MTGRQLLVSATAVASVVAVLSVVYFPCIVTRGPTPEELAERFSVFEESGLENQSVSRRIMALDANGDTYVARQELPERMQGLMRGDRNRDGLLSASEVTAVVNQKPSSRPRFNDVPLPRKEPATLTDVVKDLRLAPATHQLVMDLLNNPVTMRDRLRKVLDDEEYQNFLAAAKRIGLRSF